VVRSLQTNIPASAAGYICKPVHCQTTDVFYSSVSAAVTAVNEAGGIRNTTTHQIPAGGGLLCIPEAKNIQNEFKRNPSSSCLLRNETPKVSSL